MSTNEPTEQPPVPKPTDSKTQLEPPAAKHDSSRSSLNKINDPGLTLQVPEDSDTPVQEATSTPTQNEDSQPQASSPEDELAVQQQARINEVLFNLVDNGLENFHSSMFTADVQRQLARLLTPETNTVFAWVAGGVVQFAFEELPDLKTLSTDEAMQILYIWKTAPATIDPEETPEDILRRVFAKSIRLGRNLTELIDDISYNLIPALIADRNWPDNIRKDILNLTYKFVCNLTELQSQRDNKILLYIPTENFDPIIDNWNTNSQEHKDVCVRLETVLMHWVKQIKDLLNSQANQNDNDNSGLIEEVQFWNNCKENLVNIRSQLQHRTIKKVLNLLSFGNSNHIVTFESLSENIVKGAAQAEDNLRFLRILEGPCQQINALTPENIPSVLQNVFYSIRVLWQMCSYYGSEEKVASLFRKVSNQIIRRCSETINLNDLFEGNVETCIGLLDASISCLKRWREIYDKNTNAMRRTTCWKFGADSIFAQIEAFIQRCCDLKEICEGQIQFARRGLESQMPVFSSFKNDEIMAMLDEIKESFQKQLAKLSGANKERILDIKSTKWHEDYNVFKVGMKNLDNLYTNLITFAFDNIFTVEQAVECMIGFRTIARRDSIVIHVSKKIEKVNELTVREFHNLEQLAKLPPSHLYHGKMAARAMWQTGLLQRLQNIRRMYERLFFVDQFYKDQVETEFIRIENQLKLSIANAFRDFKENTKDLEQTLAKRLDQNILTESSAKSNSLVPVTGRLAVRTSDSKANRNKKFIESNFDRSILSFVCELDTFKRLQNQGVQAYGGRMEEFVDTQREKLSVYRKNVMLVVMDYNYILEQTSDFESELFVEHIENINNSVFRGLKILRWSSQGTLDNFVKECRTKCEQVSEKIDRFKRVQSDIQAEIKRVFSRLRFIHFDARKVQEFNSFLTVQESVGRASAEALRKMFKSIVDTLEDVYMNFIEKGERVQAAWISFLKKVDKSIEEELKHQFKAVLQELLKAITGDEKSKTNPTQIFKLYIVLKANESENRLDFEPTLPEFQNGLARVLARAVEELSAFPRLPHLMARSREKKTAEILETLQKENKNDRNQFIQGLNKKFTGNFFEIPVGWMADIPPTYQAAVTEEIGHTQNDIVRHIKAQCAKLVNQLEPWKKNSSLLTNTNDFNEPTSFVVEKTTPVASLRTAVEYYDLIQTEIQVEKTTDDSICIQVDTNKIKKKLIDLNYEEQKLLLNRIKEKSIEELRNLTKKFIENEKQLALLPTDLKRLKESADLWDSLWAKRGFIEESLGPLEDKFKLLDDYMIVFKDDETRMRMSVRENFEKFYAMMDIVKKRNDGYHQMHLADHMKRLQDFEQEMRDNRLKLLKEMPTRNEPGLTCEAAFARINVFKSYLREVRDNEKKMEFGFDLFKINYVPIPEIGVIEEEIRDLEAFWNLRARWNEALEAFWDLQFFAVNTEEVLSLCKSTRATLTGFPKAIQAYELTAEMLNTIDLYSHNMELIDLLRADYLRPRHWKVIRESVKENFDTNDKSFTLRKIMDMGLENLTEQIREVCETAFAEFKIENLLNEIINRWEKEEMEFEQLKFSTVRIISSTYAEKVEQYLEEDLVQLSSLKSNAYAFAFARQIEVWDAELNRISEVIDLLMAVEKKFVYFNNIFGNLTEDIGQLIGDKNIFNNVKVNLMGYLNRFETDKNTRRNLLTRNFKDVLCEMSQQLDTIQKHMKRYLEKRKFETPRFYFLSDEDIFEILGKAKDPMCLQRFLKKMFEGVRSLDFHQVQSAKGKVIEYTRLVSPEDERLELANRVEVNGDLNYVVQSLEKEMVNKLKSLIFECLNYSADNQGTALKSADKLEKLLYEFPGQVLLVCGQLSWTNRCFQALLGAIGDDKGLKTTKKLGNSKDNWTTLKNFYHKYILDLIGIIRRNSDELVKKKLIALITLEVHNKDLLELLSNASITSFEWLSQLRYLRNDESQDKIDVKVEQSSARFDYSFEYQGNNGRLVVTPLTDRCYLTLTSAMHFKRGGNPQGPAGTGKTETVKDLGKNLGRFVFVFNCSEGLDVKNIKNMFEGLSQTGFWGCFDEFNRIEIEVLSVIAIQINSILEAMATDARQFNFEDKEINLNKNCALFITMNPGYSGRSELPDNLKSLFRPISMIVPDSVQICRIALQAEGFKSADYLSRKIENLYNLMKQTLSTQNHYDFGLRDIKSVLSMAGDLRRTLNRESEKKTKEMEAVFEQNVLLQAFYTTAEPKLVSEDLSLFEGLLNDLFPDDYKNAKGDQDEDFIKRIDQVMDKLNLDKTGYFVEKVTQLYNTKRARHGTILIGKSMSGKSTLLNVLAEVQILGDKMTRKYVLNPKVLTVQELYGFYNQTSDESVLGVFSSIMDQLCNKDETNEEKWIVLDGPIDTMWIENMNSLLDDNKVLTLVDGNRINLREGVKLIFEVDELTQASPATVSRCGILYMDDKELNWQSIRTAWVLTKDSQQIPEPMLEFFDDLFDKWVEPLMAKKAAMVGPVAVSPIADAAQIRNLCRLLDIFLGKTQADLTNPNAINDEQLLLLIEKAFVFCVIWTIGSNLNQAGKTVFDNTLRDIESIMPFSQTIYDYSLSLDKGKFILWEDKLSIQPHQWKPPQDVSSFDSVVETVDTARIRFFLNTLLEERENVLLIGPSSVGKTVLVRTLLKNMDENLYSYNLLNLTSGTTSQRLQESIEAKLARTTKKKFRPFSGKKGFVFVDDLALPKKDGFGYQPTLELLRQVLEHSGWYDRASLDLFVQVKEVNYVGAMREGQVIPTRLLNKFFVLGILQPNESQLRRIYSSVLYYNMSEFDGEEIKSEIDNLVGFIIGAFRSISTDEAFISTPTRPHYLFSLKDITRIVQGISLIDKINCDSKSILLKLALHESVRVFEDKMVSPADQALVRKRLYENFDGTFEAKSAELCPNDEVPTFVNFVDVRGAYACVVPRTPEEATDEVIRASLEEQLVLFNKEQKNPISLALFSEAVFQVCKISRILAMDKGHALLIGDPGTGKHCLAKLAAFVAGQTVYEQKATSLAAFRTNLKQNFEISIFKSAKFVLMFGEGDIEYPEILQDVNSLLSLGEVPNLFSKREGKDEFGKIRDKIKMDIKKENDEAIFDHFLATIQTNMHIVFCANKGEGLRKVIRDQGGFVYNTTQIFFGSWPQSALKQVATRFLARMEIAGKDQLADFFAQTHFAVSSYLQAAPGSNHSLEVTPKTFIDLEKTFESLYDRKSREVDQKLFKYRNGIGKLEETQKNVEELKASMDIKRVELNKKKKECEDMIYKIDFEKRESAKEKKNIEEKEELLTREKEETMKLAAAARLQLEKAEPVLLEAKNKVKDLDNNSIAEIKVLLKTKDKRLELIMFSLMVLLGEKPKWDSVQKAVTDANFLKKIRELEMDKIDEPVVQKLEQYTQQPEIQGSLENFSKSVNILATFIKAVEVYVKVNLDVKPIRDNVIKLNRQLEAKEEELQRLKDNLQETLERLDQLNTLFDSLNAEYQLFLSDFAALEQRLDRAEKLVAGLSFSYESWVNYLKYYTDYSEKLLGNVMLSACLLTYFGALGIEQRQHVLSEILLPLLRQKKVVFSPDFNFVTFLVDEVTLLNWNFKSLPNDQTSLENAVIVQNAFNWPYIIDPQDQCLNWLKNLEAGAKLVLTDYTTNKLNSVVEKAVVDGATLIYQHGGEELAQCLQFLLQKSIKRVLDKFVMGFGEKDVTFNPAFRFFITTRIPEPTLKQDVSSKVTVVNFTVVQKGLEEQLLGFVLRILDEKLETQRVESIKVKSNCEVILRDLENKVLEMLKSSQDKPLVDSGELIEMLQVFREKEEEIKTTLEATKLNFKKINASRESYRSLGYLASVLYFAVSQMARINSVYQFSLDNYFREFESVLLKVSDKKNDFSDSLNEKIRKIDGLLRRKIYKRYCDFLFEKDRLLLGFQMAITMAPIDHRMNAAAKAEEGKKKFGATRSSENLENEANKNKYWEEEFKAEFAFFVRPFSLPQPENQEVNPDPNWISQSMWETINQLNTLPVFQGIVGSFLHNTKEWKKFFMSPRPEAEVLPSDWSQKIRRFSFVLLVKVVRPDRLHFAITQFVKTVLGPAFVEPVSFNFERIHKRLVKKKRPMPILIILGPNVDPFSYVEAQAKKQGIMIHQISLGQGGLAKAKDKILKGIQESFWVYLGNIHLSPLLMKELDIILDMCRSQAKGFGFQLIMTSKPADCLSLNVLQNTYKTVIEPVKGVRANMQRVLSNLIPEFKPTDEREAISEFILYRKLCYSLCWLHCILNERKRFRSLGWNISYEFSDTDLVYSEKIIYEFINSSQRNSDQGFQWEAFRYLLGQINYGGRVTDQWDARLLNVIVREIFTEELLVQKDFNFCGEMGGPYRMPPASDENLTSMKNKMGVNFGAIFSSFRNDLLTFVKELPEHELPEVFGQHINAEITIRIEDSKQFLDALTALDTTLAPTDAAPANENEFNLSTFVGDLLEKLPAKISISDFNDKIKAANKESLGGFVDLVTIFFMQEAKKYNAILDAMRSDLQTVQGCLKGKVMLTEDIEATLTQLNNMRLPRKWQSFYASAKPLNLWFEDLGKRVAQIVEWQAKGYLVKYWLGGFIYPTGFLTAVLQTTARKSGISIDNLKWDFQFMGAEGFVNSPPKDGVYVYGMFLEGGKFRTSDNKLVEADPMVLYSPMPVVHFKPVEKNAKAITKPNVYNCPVYIYPVRKGANDVSSYLFSMTLPFAGQKETTENFWVKRGTAILLSLDN